MLDRVARLVVRRRWPVLGLALLALVGAGAFGGGVADRLTGGGFDDPGSESYRADQILEHTFGETQPNLVLLVDAPTGASVDDPAVAAAGTALTQELAGETDVHQVASVLVPRVGAPAAGRRRPPGAGAGVDPGRRRPRRRRDRGALAPLPAGGWARRDHRARGWVVGGLPPGRRHHRPRPAPGRAHHPARHAPVAGADLRLGGGGLAAARRRRVRRHRHVLRAAGAVVVHRRLDLRAEPHDRAGPRPGHRLQPVHRLALPRGAGPRPRHRRVDPAHARRRPAARSCSPRPRWRPRWPPCSCSRSCSCGRSPTPGSPWWRWPPGRRCSCCRRCSPPSARG